MTILNHETGTDQLLVEVAGSVATVTFNNPARRNALTAQMRAALPAALAALNADGDVRVVVATGAGEAAFMSGADISEFAAQRTARADRPPSTAARPATPTLVSIRRLLALVSCAGGRG
jgi:enoyl-CoA hydratase/carnithine racemase